MNRDFFIKVTVATHKVAGVLPAGDLQDRMIGSSNSLLADLILSSESNMDPEEKRLLVIRALKELGALLACFYEAKERNLAFSANFLVLERAYGKVRGILEKIAQVEEVKPFPELSRAFSSKKEATSESLPAMAPVSSGATLGELSSRQQKILDLLTSKGKAQVWELQKLLPEVTKRTLRRDLDDLLKRNLIERAGEWNAIFYKIKPVENMLVEVGQR